ncbi:hypothetical protein MCEMAEM4_03382 [Burkholderiaceae bacterium]
MLSVPTYTEAPPAAPVEEDKVILVPEAVAV